MEVKDDLRAKVSVMARCRNCDQGHLISLGCVVPDCIECGSGRLELESVQTTVQTPSFGSGREAYADGQHNTTTEVPFS